MKLRKFRNPILAKQPGHQIALRQCLGIRNLHPKSSKIVPVPIILTFCNIQHRDFYLIIASFITVYYQSRNN